MSSLENYNSLDALNRAEVVAEAYELASLNGYTRSTPPAKVLERFMEEGAKKLLLEEARKQIRDKTKLISEKSSTKNTINNYGCASPLMINGNGANISDSTINMAPAEMKKSHVGKEHNVVEEPPTKRARFSPDTVNVEWKPKPSPSSAAKCGQIRTAKEDIESAPIQVVVGAIRVLGNDNARIRTERNSAHRQMLCMKDDVEIAAEEKAKLQSANNELRKKLDDLEKEKKELQRELSWWRRWANVA